MSNSNVRGEATICMTVDLDTYNRLSDLFRVAPSDTVIRRLLDRDPHDHAHACPTCSRIAARAHAASSDEQPDLFAVG